MKVKEKLLELCNSLEVELDVSTFPKRKRIQKLTYLLQVFGMDLGFKFSWYIHGPYDSNLTRVLYNDDPKESNRDVKDHFKDEEKKLKLLIKFLGRDINSSRTLELIGSLHHLLVLAKKDNTSDEEVLQKLLDRKPFFSEGETRYYLKRINENLPI